MISQELIDQILRELEQGIPLQSVKQGLLVSGWAAEDIDQAAKMAESGQSPDNNQQLTVNKQQFETAVKSPSKGKKLRVVLVEAILILVLLGAAAGWWFWLR